MPKTYTVTAERGTSDVWVLECADLGVVSQTRRLAHAAAEMREAMAYQAGVSPDNFNIVVEVILPSNIAELKTRADEQRREAARLTTEAQESTRELAAAMKKSGMTVRDMGEILGVSYQRAQKLATA
ncbi:MULTISPECIES: hypothetical protein [Corynebacterium]|uniref:Antitoxin HicB n=1 Tax=Corynebacterium ramonii TaxID=3026968 RepID=A0ABN4EFL2_9CORY|nr:MULTISPECIES: hypothetical protein [Corynebacterium]AIU31693.1 Hypothetical protein CulFRC11_0088 [Corynebacterium ramonii FRC0011]ESU59220.1 hypothetical protein D881_00900 [Corynebacterium ulcerans NCTC 12077]STC80070.1 Uncharacterised protein [Corynebacterium ulcerans]